MSNKVPKARRRRATMRGFAIGVGLASLLLLAAGPTMPSSADAPSTAGDLDLSFGTGGYDVRDLGGWDSVEAVWAGSTVVVLAQSYPTGGPVTGALLRYRTDGTLDPTFSSDGITELPAGGCCGDIHVDSDGAILLLTSAVTDQGPVVALARYLADGDPDLAFGVQGRVELTDIFPRDMAIQADGKIVLVGETEGVRDLAVLRLDASGALDATFADDGLAAIDLGTLNDFGWRTEVLANGEILVLASRRLCDAEFFCRVRGYLLRLDDTGSLDRAFGDGGITWWRFRNLEPLDMALDARGGVIVLMGQSGVWGCPSGNSAGLIKFRGRGTVARGFAEDGRFWPGRVDAASVAVQADGHILIAGNYCATGWPPDSALERLTRSGDSDSEFGIDGLSAPRLGSLATRATAMVLDLAGNIVLAGISVVEETGDDIVVARYLGG
jgi:uncharacterized delta-60 repeat protein